MKSRIQYFLNSGHVRTVKAKKNILLLFIIKGISIIINLAYVPLLISTFGKEEYGIWLVLTSFMSWMSFFDIGVGNGTRNYLAKALAVNDIKLAKSYISTTYAIFTCIFLPLGLLTLIVSPWIDWSAVFNTNSVDHRSLFILTTVTLVFFALRFIVQTINIVLLADQRPAMSSFINMTFNVVSIITIFLLNRLEINSLIFACSTLSFIPIVVLSAFSVFLFNFDYKLIAPSLKYVNLKLSKNILSLGVKFFVIQISGIVIYSSTNLIITQIFNPSAVTEYNISFKYFSIITMLYGIIMAPLWSSITHAYALKDYQWIKRIFSKFTWMSLILTIGIIVMLVVSPYAYSVWIGDKVEISFSLSLIIAVQTVLYVWLSPFVTFLNGVGKIHLVSYLVVVQSLIFIPLILLVVRVFHFGIVGIVLASIFLEIPLKIVQILQYRKIINGTARGVWFK